MNTIIVSVMATIDNVKYMYDLEVPVDQSGVELAREIIEAINEEVKEKNKSQVQNIEENSEETNKEEKAYSIYINKSRRLLGDYETLGSAGVRNGDYLRVDEKK